MATTSPVRQDYRGPVVIGAGLPRTGTLSMHAALERVLKGKCYHMHDFGTLSKEGLVFWERALKRQLEKEVFQHTAYYYCIDFI